MPELPDVIHLPGPTVSTPKAKASRSGSEVRQMSPPKPVRLTNGELADAEARAQAAGQSVEDYMRKVADQEPGSNGGGDHVTSRAHVKYLRWPSDQLARVEGYAARTGLSYGSYVRACALKHPVTLTRRRPPPIEHIELAQLLGSLGKVAGNLNQIARQLNMDGDVPLVDVRDAISSVQAAAGQIIESMGRASKPRDRR